ncbi:hypothetical protein QJS04_geneDACA007834 [Acorus gramineus]|uniref:Uncharacterized protein n=1 Tax=Acorus gramineus TaxID=55184 RepID=A0AAV9B785_ACOGR|nr:hypothetical protein QJS04_geneDACA007834 [Acorus gramineus]
MGFSVVASRCSVNSSIAYVRPCKSSFCPALPPAMVVPSRGRGVGNIVISHGVFACSAVQESSAATVTEKKEPANNEKKGAPEKATEKPKRPAKAVEKALPLMMEEDVIPPLKSLLESQEDLSQIDISFQDNRLEGSFMKKDVPYYFWAFFPDGVLTENINQETHFNHSTGPKGFSLSSYGLSVSTVEPFLIDEKRINAKQVVFWVHKRLAAQGILPVWKD